MTVYQVLPSMERLPFTAGFYVNAEDLRRLLLDWEKRLTNDGLTATMSDVVTEMNRERRSLHCEPEMPPPVHTWHGRDIDTMDFAELREALKSTTSNFR